MTTFMFRFSPVSKQFLILWLAAAVVCAVVGCGGGASTSDVRPAPETVGERADELPDDSIPVALIVEKEFTGRQLETGLRGPTGVAYDGGELLYITDTRNHRVIQLDTALTYIDDVGGFGSQEGLFNRPMYLTVDFALNILVADYGNRRLARYNSHLEYVDAIRLVDPVDPLRFGNPQSVAVTSYGEAWVTDPERNQVVVFDHVGQFERVIGDFGYSGGELQTPSKIILDRRQYFVVCDSENGRLVRYNLDGNFVDEPGDRELGFPVGVAQSRDGYWVIDQQTSELILLNDHGDFVTAIPPMLSGSTVPLSKPSDLVMIGDERIVIVDTGNNRIVVCRIVYG